MNFYFYVFLKLVPSEYINFLHNHSILFHFRHFFKWKLGSANACLPSHSHLCYLGLVNPKKVGSYLFLKNYLSGKIQW